MNFEKDLGLHCEICLRVWGFFLNNVYSSSAKDLAYIFLAYLKETITSI